MGKKVFCEHCNEEVLTYSVMKDGVEEVCCLYCGLPLKKLTTPFVSDATKKTILYAEDSAFMRELVKDIVTKHLLANDFFSYSNGEDLITSYLKLLLERKKVSCIILDIRMPFLSGLSTAIAIRAIERGLDALKTPFLFFSAKAADLELKKFITHTTPSFYLNKGVLQNIEDIEERLVYVLRSIISTS